jgi:uncharacterized protein YggT (Ycf19 family)
MDNEKNSENQPISKKELIIKELLGIRISIDSINLKTNELDELKQRVATIENRLSSFKNNSANKKTWGIIIGFTAILILLVVFTSIFQPNDYTNELNSIDAGITNKINEMHSTLIDKLNKEPLLIDKLTFQDKDEIKKELITNIVKRDNLMVSNFEKTREMLIRNVVIINLIGRYTVILCCIVAFALIIRAFAHSRIKDDIFE